MSPGVRVIQFVKLGAGGVLHAVAQRGMRLIERIQREQGGVVVQSRRQVRPKGEGLIAVGRVAPKPVVALHVVVLTPPRSGQAEHAEDDALVVSVREVEHLDHPLKVGLHQAGVVVTVADEKIAMLGRPLVRHQPDVVQSQVPGGGEVIAIHVCIEAVGPLALVGPERVLCRDETGGRETEENGVFE